MSHPIDRNAAALAILAGLAANPECVHLPLELLVNHAVRLADLLGTRLAEPAQLVTRTPGQQLADSLRAQLGAGHA